jgi:hypothetical protein
MTHDIVGARLPAMAACQPENGFWYTAIAGKRAPTGVVTSELVYA